MKDGSTMKRKSNWSNSEQVIFLKRLGELLQHGYSISQAIEFLELQQNSSSQQKLNQATTILKEGGSLYELFVELSFHPEALSYLFFAEKHGDLSDALLEASSMLRRKNEQKEKVMKIVRYPIFLIICVIIMFTLIEKMLFPNFQALLQSMNGEETFLITVLTNLPSVTKMTFFFLLLVLALCFLYFYLHFKNLPASTKMEFYLKLPIIKSFLPLINSHFLSIQLSNLIKGGLSIHQSLQLFEQQTHKKFFREEAADITKQLTTGERLDNIIARRGFYEKELALIIFHAQSNGSMASELYHYSQYVLQKLEEKTTRVMTVIQPILFAVIGLMIIVMYVAMLFPMFNLLNNL